MVASGGGGGGACAHFAPLGPALPPERNVSIAAVRGAVRPPKTHKIALKFL